jgi:hypothetical protein
MGIFHFYLHKSQLIIPTVYETEDGMYVDDSPVSVCSIANEEKLRAAIKNELEKGNPKQAVSPDSFEHKAGSVILEKLGLKHWAAFEKESLMVTCHTSDEECKIYITGRARDGMWSHDIIGPARLDKQASLDDIAAFIVAEVQIKDKTMPPNAPPPLLLSPPPA